MSCRFGERVTVRRVATRVMLDDGVSFGNPFQVPAEGELVVRWSPPRADSKRYELPDPAGREDELAWVQTGPDKKHDVRWATLPCHIEGVVVGRVRKWNGKYEPPYVGGWEWDGPGDPDEAYLNNYGQTAIPMLVVAVETEGKPRFVLIPEEE